MAEDFQEINAIVDVPPGAVTIDYFVAEPAQTEHALGSAIIRAVVADTWSTYPDCPAIIAPVVAGTSRRGELWRKPDSGAWVKATWCRKNRV